jgi:hypothetical protein
MMRTPYDEVTAMKLWVFLQCPRCGYEGCVAPVNESPCPKCGFQEKSKKPSTGEDDSAPAA